MRIDDIGVTRKAENQVIHRRHRISSARSENFRQVRARALRVAAPSMGKWDIMSHHGVRFFDEVVED